MSQQGRLIVVSNRIPTEAAPSGGLVVALHEALESRGGIWIGSSGQVVDEPGGLKTLADDKYTRLAFDLTKAEHEGFYLGYANSVLWPLFHHRADLIDVDQGDRDQYMGVNARVAQLIAEVIEPNDVLWIHDYHFLPLAAELRKLGLDNRMGYFLHIPFPNPSDIAALPDRKQLPHWIAAYDLIGLQTQRDVSACLEWLRGDTAAEFTLRGRMKLDTRHFEVRSFPIGIDVDAFRDAAERADITITDLPTNQKLILGVDRLDYSKGLPNRFEAFGKYLSMRDKNLPHATMIQVAPPSREDVEAYKDIRVQLESMAGSVNGEHAELDWTPIRYLRRPLPRDVVAGLYRRADVCLVTPLADGMNLVAKEYVAAQDGADPGVLILSHFAGAAEQLDGALMVNPYDTVSMAEAIDQALKMDLHERRARWLSMMQVIRETDIDWWTNSFLRSLQNQPQMRVA
ncbi:probable OtsA trehalose-6-phosphate synthase [Oceanicola granulosus HTCC2516]|uniref:Probable OtsA trehalose-6-phosphate synthase n=1 Tax=Oceanicola granulosus (strain ATCC BAA-861 / DSM 15982 / KCTC 12143 / HTCC2516) TaxID=314256 RepID=Q2CIT3_OCEGH|nr:trehalose-6-phosphate synthase [Oceanicola granulosus]EAR52506.1 probable OtsA trehalose-6-phosphate synthase [Oceanicola granulosus HTCC2516]